MPILPLIALALTALAPSPDSTVTKETLGDGIYLFRAPSTLEVWTATNVVVVVNEQDVTVFDSNTRPSTARVIIAEIRKLTSKPVRTLINSHWHLDHWSGNGEYAKAFPGIQIIATTMSRDYMKRMPASYFVAELAGSIARTPDSAGKADLKRLSEEVAVTTRVPPNVAFGDTLIFWSGRREFRLMRETGDASGSTVLYMPHEKLLVTGDVLVSPEDGNGPPPWTTTSYNVVPWLASLRSLQALDIDVIVPGQGPVQHGKSYLDLTVRLYAAIVDQVHAAQERGVPTLHEVQAAVNVDSIGMLYPPHGKATEDFHTLVTALTKKAYQEAIDGANQP